MLRAQEKAILGKGSYRTLYADGNLLAFERFVFTEDARHSLTLVVNRSSRPQSILRAGLDMEEEPCCWAKPWKAFTSFPPTASL